MVEVQSIERENAVRRPFGKMTTATEKGGDAVVEIKDLISICDLMLERLARENPNAPWIVIGADGFSGSRYHIKQLIDSLVRKAYLVREGLPPITQADVDRDWRAVSGTKRGITTAIGFVKRIREWAVALNSKNEKIRRVGRPTNTEKDSATIVVAALTSHHGYENGAVTQFAPATNRGLATQFGLSPNALSRFLASRFPHEQKPHKKYVAACRNGTIGLWLMLWNRESPRHMAELTTAESGRRDGE
jgi:hypothetical protein